MKKIIISLLGLGFVIFLTIFLLYLVSNKSNTNSYGLGKAGTFENKRYEIHINHYGFDKCFDLHDVETDKVILHYILRYKDDSKNSILYAVGKDNPNDKLYKYIVLNYKKGEFKEYNSIKQMRADDRDIFNKQEKFNSLYFRYVIN